jgi:methylmalonyl-CoA mutase
LLSTSESSIISIDAVYTKCWSQYGSANALAHANEYFNRIPIINKPIVFEVSVGTNYFFEIAKLRVPLTFNLIAKEYNHNLECHLLVSPTKRNKTYMIKCKHVANHN